VEIQSGHHGHKNKRKRLNQDKQKTAPAGAVFCCVALFFVIKFKQVDVYCSDIRKVCFIPEKK